MANRWLRQFIKTADTEMVQLDGYCSVTSDGYTVSSASDTLPMASVAFVSTGLYRITLEDKWSSLKSISITPMLKAAVADRVACVTLVDLPNKKIEFAFHAAGTVQNIGAGNGFYIRLALKNSGLGTGK